jgi:hypothetical protein
VNIHVNVVGLSSTYTIILLRNKSKNSLHTVGHQPLLSKIHVMVIFLQLDNPELFPDSFKNIRGVGAALNVWGGTLSARRRQVTLQGAPEAHPAGKLKTRVFEMPFPTL